MKLLTLLLYQFRDYLNYLQDNFVIIRTREKTITTYFVFTHHITECTSSCMAQCKWILERVEKYGRDELPLNFPSLLLIPSVVQTSNHGPGWTVFVRRQNVRLSRGELPPTLALRRPLVLI